MTTVKKPIVISGFGRSGTTWLSDIISKSLGGLILFEPFHPKVFPQSEQLVYSQHLDSSIELGSYWNDIKQGKNKSKWLLRNHLRSPYEQAPEAYVNSIWDHSRVLGLKTIRANHLLSELNKALGGIRLIYIIRHPLACLASINRRQEFWNEYGWEWHWKTFLERLCTSPQLSTLKRWFEISERLRNRNEQIVFMWAVSQQIALEQVDQIGGIITSYEALYLKPFEETQRILTLLGDDDAVHPSYLFEPSMTSMRTLHNSLSDYQKVKERFPAFFWEDDLSPEEGQNLLQSIQNLDINRPEILRYLNT